MNILEQRASLLKRLRQFFDERGFLEVETPLLSSEIIPELNIEPSRVATQHTAHTPMWLQPSPEAHMKRLLAAGAEAIYQITRSFRTGERGPLHRPEFTIVEWYRTGDDMQSGMGLLDELCQQMLDTPPAKRTSYAEAFERHAGISPHRSSCDALAKRAKELSLVIPDGTNRSDQDQWLNLLLTMCVESKLGCDTPEILYDYPASQASLAKIRTDDRGLQIAERFELYYQGVELANGYYELTDADELRKRLLAVNAAREADGRQELPMPQKLLAAMEAGLPNCSGVALGFDRLFMLVVGAKSIDKVVAFPTG